MKLLKIICGIATYCLCTNAYGYSLHVGDKSFVLGSEKTTSPALAMSINGITFYGALYSGVAPQKTLRVQHGDKEYWLGQNCDAGMYSETGVSACTDCTIGHYCPGGARHTPCTYGAMSCKTKNLTTEGALPDGAPINNFMTLDQVNEFIPVTDASDWRQISCCNSPHYPQVNPNTPSALNNSKYACATGTIGPGTYLFTMHYERSEWGDIVDSVYGNTGSRTHAVIAVFDHPVSYASIHGDSIFQHFIDTEHVTYTEWTLSTTPIRAWATNKNETNISNLKNIPNDFWSMLCVYELK